MNDLLSLTAVLSLEPSNCDSERYESSIKCDDSFEYVQSNHELSETVRLGELSKLKEYLPLTKKKPGTFKLKLQEV